MSQQQTKAEARAEAKAEAAEALSAAATKVDERSTAEQHEAHHDKVKRALSDIQAAHEKLFSALGEADQMDMPTTSQFRKQMDVVKGLGLECGRKIAALIRLEPPSP